MNTTDRSKSIEELEGDVWGASPADTSLVKGIYAARKKPIQDLTVEDLRLCILQNDFLEYLMPLALEKLKEDPFIAGEMYEGDLLFAVLCVKDTYWREHADQKAIVTKIMKRERGRIDEVFGRSTGKFFGKVLKRWI